MPVFLDITNTLNNEIHTINLNQISVFNKVDKTLILTGVSEPIRIKDEEVAYVSMIINRYKVNTHDIINDYVVNNFKGVVKQ